MSMKITKTQLKQIIKEELESTINEDGHTDVPSAIRKLKTATEDAMQILHALEGHHDQELPSWWMSKLTLAADYLNKARDYLLVPSETMEEYPWLLIFPGLVLTITLFSLNFLGDGLRDALDVRNTKE